MFDLELSISTCRSRMLAAGIPPHAVAELIAHLRDETSALTRSGMDIEQAFIIAQSNVGNPKSLLREFEKSTAAGRRPVKVVLGLWLAAFGAITLAVYFQMRTENNANALLGAHIITLTVGYIAVCISGIFGLSHVAFRFLNQLTPGRRETFVYGIKIFTRVAFVLTFLGVGLGWLWSARNYSESYSGIVYVAVLALLSVLKLRAYGSVAVCFWLLMAIFVQRRRPAADRTNVSLSIIGNLIVGLAWFGPFIFWSDLRAAYSMERLWPVQAIFGLHLVFLCLNFIRRNAHETESIKISS